MGQTHVVTGAFGYSGKYLARRLLAAGVKVRTLTNHPRTDDPVARSVEASPLRFDDPASLVESLRGASVLYNTYWVRFERGSVTHGGAVENTKVLFDAARKAGVERIVHVSITNPSASSPLPYFSGKAELESYLRASGVSHAIVRPTVLFGMEDILVNNIAYLLRRLPVFGIPGDGLYRIQPVFVDDLAGLMAEMGERRDDVTVDAVGPEVYTYEQMVRLVGKTVGARAMIARVPPWLLLAAGRVIGMLTGDVVITPEEVRGLMADLLVSHSPATCRTSFRGWVEDNCATLGKRYASEISRHFV